jgi:hypothetical protein
MALRSALFKCLTEPNLTTTRCQYKPPSAAVKASSKDDNCSDDGEDANNFLRLHLGVRRPDAAFLSAGVTGRAARGGDLNAGEGARAPSESASC